MATLRPSLKPPSASPRLNAASRGAKPSGVPSARNPTSGIAGCCAYAAIGHVAAAPPKSAMNSRRLIAQPLARTTQGMARYITNWADNRDMWHSRYVTWGRIALANLGDNRQQHMRRVLAVVKNLVQHRLARADMVRHVFGVGGAGDAGRQIETGDVEGAAVAFAEQVGGRHHLDLIVLDGPRRHRLLRFAGQRMPRPEWPRAFRIDGAVRGFEPAA